MTADELQALALAAAQAGVPSSDIQRALDNAQDAAARADRHNKGK